MNDTEVIGALLRKADRNLRSAGVKSQSKTHRNGAVTHRFVFPLKRPIKGARRLAISHTEQPTVIVGGKVGKKIKAGLKKVAKSKALGKVLKAASVITAVVPGGQAAAAGLAAAATAQKMAVKAAAKGKKAVKAVKGAVKAVKAVKGAVKQAKGAVKQVKAAAKGKPAAAVKKAALKTAAKALPAAKATRPASAAAGIPITLPSGKKALVTFVK